MWKIVLIPFRVLAELMFISLFIVAPNVFGDDGAQNKTPNEQVAERFMWRDGNSVAVYKDQLWLLERGVKDKVWSSSDGIKWTRQPNAAEFPPRRFHKIIVFKDQLWLVGIDDNDTWSSTDGITWVKQVSTDMFSWRDAPEVIVYNNKLWLIGGRKAQGGCFVPPEYKNDVWSSSDGFNWKQETAAAAFSPRNFHQLAVFDNKLWLIGGTDHSGRLDDVWSSIDGVNWTEQGTITTMLPKRSGFKLVAYNDGLWLIGGSDYYVSLKNDIWWSSDGVNWIQKTAAAAFPGRVNHEVVGYKNLLWLIGGLVSGAEGNGRKNDVWSSSDGIEWNEASEEP